MAQENGYIDTDQGATFFTKIGIGPPVVVVHGGPGFDHTYLVQALESLAFRRTLIFYDQPGCGKTADKLEAESPQQIYAHFKSFVHEITDGQEFGVIAHSWGALVFIAALFDDSLPSPALPPVREGVLINPLPLTSDEYAKCRDNLLCRIPSDVLQKAESAVLSQINGSALMELILPSYHHSREFVLPLDQFHLNLATYLSINEQLHSYDYSKIIRKLDNVSCLLADDDFIDSVLLDDLLPCLTNVKTIKSAGHFSMYERPDIFQKFMREKFS